MGVDLGLEVRSPLSWFGIVRLGLVQTALGAIFVLATSTLNRVMVVELALPAVLPGALIALHYAMQVLRPRLGHGSDLGGRRTPWIIGGMAVLAFGGFVAACATALMRTHLAFGIAMAVVAFVLIGIGVGASGTALLVLLAKMTTPIRRPAAATIVWIMMIAGFIVTAAVAGKTLDPFSPARLVAVAAVISAGAFLLSLAAVWRIEVVGDEVAVAPAGDRHFAAALREVWSERSARRFAIFIFVSMLAYGGEELVLEPFAGSVFAMSPAQTAKLSGMLHAGSLVGMVLVAIAGTGLARLRIASGIASKIGSMQVWMIGGCVASGAGLAALAAVGLTGGRAWLEPAILLLGLSNGAYAIAAIGSMMQRVGAGGPAREGVRMGVWGAAQAVAFGAGGLAATGLSDAARHLFPGLAAAYATVFLCQAAVFLAAATLATTLRAGSPRGAALAPLQGR